MTLLSVRGLSKAFGGVRAVEDVSFDVNPGELLALIGPNGAGKSTCFNMLNGQIRADRGQIMLDGVDIAGWTPRRIWRAGVGRTFQITATFGSMSVVENVQMVLTSARRGMGGLWTRLRDRHRDEAMALLERVGMASQADRPCGVLAYGDLKRVELAVALAHGPRLLLMDEPTAGMAPAERLDLMELTSGLVRADGVGVLFTEHDMDVVFGHATRVLVLNRGQLIAHGSPAEVRANEAVREVYLGSGARYGQGHDDDQGASS
jgi:branched-chain amino acid transport system ATP-binding protein